MFQIAKQEFNGTLGTYKTWLYKKNIGQGKITHRYANEGLNYQY
jgi:hypothetical protein